MYVPHNTKEKRYAYKSKCNLERENQHHLVIYCLHIVHLIQKNKLDYYRGKNCLKNFCLYLREHTTKIMNYKKKEMIPLTRKEKKTHKKQEVCHIWKKGFSTDDNNKKYHKV